MSVLNSTPGQAAPSPACTRARARKYRESIRGWAGVSGRVTHRRFAVSINLNAEGVEGGDLRFPEFGSRTYRPPTGGAVVFCCALLHEATPVTRGRRYAFLPFLYDVDGQQIREANLSKFPDATPAAGS